MAELALQPSKAPDSGMSSWRRLATDRNWLGMWFMVPAAAFLILFLAYPLVLGIWISFTDARIGENGEFVGLENYEWLSDDSVFWLSVFNTLLYTAVASVIKFGIGLYLALLLNQHMPFKALVRAVVLIPFIVPTVLSAMAFWWLFDAQFSVISWSLRHLGLISGNIDFLGDPWNARWSVIFANIWRGIPFVAPRRSRAATVPTLVDRKLSHCSRPAAICAVAGRTMRSESRPGETGSSPRRLQRPRRDARRVWRAGRTASP